jgi:hypothetical protein
VGVVIRLRAGTFERRRSGEKVESVSARTAVLDSTRLDTTPCFEPHRADPLSYISVAGMLLVYCYYQTWIDEGIRLPFRCMI